MLGKIKVCDVATVPELLGSDSGDTLTIIIIVLAALIIAGVTVLLIRRERKKKRAGDGKPETDDAQSQPEEKK